MKQKRSAGNKPVINAGPDDTGLEPSYVEDPQVHRPPVKQDAVAPAPAEKPEPATSPKVEEPAEDTLSQPLKYVVSSEDAIERVEKLLELVKESRPDLKQQVDTVLQQIESLEKKAWGIDYPEAGAPEGQAAAPAAVFSPGDKVQVEAEGQTYTGTLVDQNEDGTWEVDTDQQALLSNVPAESLQPMTGPSEAGMSLPAAAQAKALMIKLGAGLDAFGGLLSTFVEGKSVAEALAGKTPDEIKDLVGLWKQRLTEVGDMIESPEFLQNAIREAEALLPQEDGMGKKAAVAASKVKAGGVDKAGSAIDWTESPEAFVFTINPEMQEEFKEQLAQNRGQNALLDLLEPVIANSDIDWIRPEEVAALTDAPIFGHVTRDDSGKIETVGNIWWYPDYAVKDPIQELAEKGEITFAGAPENIKDELKGEDVKASKKNKLHKLSAEAFKATLSKVKAKLKAEVELQQGAVEDGEDIYCSECGRDLSAGEAYFSFNGIGPEAYPHYCSTECAEKSKASGSQELLRDLEEEDPFAKSLKGSRKDRESKLVASAFDEIKEIELGNGWILRRKKGTEKKSEDKPKDEAKPTDKAGAPELKPADDKKPMPGLAPAALQAADEPKPEVADDKDKKPEPKKDEKPEAKADEKDKPAKGEKKADGPMIEVVDADGKVVDTLPDAFGTDTVTIIKLFKQLYPESQKSEKKDDKGEKKDEKPEAKSDDKADKADKADKPKDSKEAPLEDKPKALPAIKVSKEEAPAMAAAQAQLEQRILAIRNIVSTLVDKNHVVADQKDIDELLMVQAKGQESLEAAMDAALKKAADREFKKLLAMPDAYLLTLKASLPNLPVRAAQIRVQASSEGLGFMDSLTVHAEKIAKDGGYSLGDAFARGGFPR